jgi:hypothetical protein
MDNRNARLKQLPSAGSVEAPCGKTLKIRENPHFHSLTIVYSESLLPTQ